MALELFNYNDTTVRVVQIDGEPWFVLTDLAQVLGIGNARDVAARLSEDVKGVDQIDTPGGSQRMTVVNEPGMYEVVLRSDKPEAVEFRRWITGTVLPEIRRTGQYGAQRELTGPELVARALIEANSMIEEMRPKAEFHDAVTASDSTMLLHDFAKVLASNGMEIGGRRLFAWLRDNGYLCSSRGSWNMPRIEYVKQGLFEVSKVVYSRPDGTSGVSHTTRLTGKGQSYFVAKFRKSFGALV